MSLLPKRPDFYRLLNPKEQLLATKVFANTLPPWNQIGIGNGLGLGGAPWIGPGDANFPQTPNVRYMINLGAVASTDLTSTNGTYSILGDNYGIICELFIHEMTHVWQYFHGFSVAASSMWAHTFGSYDFTAGDSWDSYNKEQQASIVEKWQHGGNSKDDELYPYILWVIQGGGDKLSRSMTLDQLRSLSSIADGPDDNLPVQVGVKDDAVVIKLSNDALFDLNKDDLKPAAVNVLQQAGTRIKSTPGRYVVVEGHTDNTGSPAYNMDLSKRRAKTVAQWLTSNRFVSDVKIEGAGMTRPLESNSSAAGRAKNRRVEILLVKR